jgi:hypothetical protein
MEFHRIRLLFGVMLAFSFPHAALSQLALRVVAPGSVSVSNELPYSITVTNRGTPVGFVNVSSSFSRSLQFVRATSNANVTATISDGRVDFVIQSVITNVTFNLTLRPTLIGTGTVTNFFAVSLGNVLDSTNVSTTVTEVPGNADVAVVITPLSTSPVFVNDWMAVNVGLFNRGGGTVSGIFLTNRLTNAIVRDFRPSAGGSLGQNGTRLIFNVGSLAAGQTTNYHLTVQPTRTTNVSLTSNFRSSGNADTNPANNTATAMLTVQQHSTTNQLKAEIASSQQFNPQNAFMEQRITVKNEGPNVARNSRVIISNATFRVVNAVGTNNAHPFVLHAAPIQPGETVELLLEYFIPNREPRPDPDLIAYATSEVAPAARTTGTYTNIALVVWREPFGSMTESNLVLFFRSEPGAVYELQYSPGIEFANVLRALPLITAQANSTVFIDYGPPKTISRPLREITFTTNRMPIFDETGTNVIAFTNSYVTNLNMRFYRAMKLP